MVAGGDIIYAADVNRRLATTLGTADVAATSGTTEKAIDQVTANVVNGVSYHLKWILKWAGSVANDEFVLRLRTGSGIAGTELQSNIIKIITGQTYTETVEIDWGSGVSGSQTFSATVQRISGTGTLTAKGASTVVRSLTVELV